jgi:GDPmannose 4,6-dehydratase
VPTAIIIGISGQDGAYLGRYLLNARYRVIGLSRQPSNAEFRNLRALGIREAVEVEQLQMPSPDAIGRLIARYQPDEIYCYAGPSSVSQSYEQPYVAATEVPAFTCAALEAIRTTRPQVRFLNTASSECFGDVASVASEQTAFRPASPYGVAKAHAYHVTANYRSAFGLFACTAILFNHESPIRGPEFVSRKIARSVAEISCGMRSELQLGNLDARRDWGHAQDYVEGMWRMLQQTTARDYVLASGVSHSIRDVVELAFAHVGRTVTWQGEGVHETGSDARTGQRLVSVEPRYFRPLDPKVLTGSAAKALADFGWRVKRSLADLVAEMVESELADIRKERPW